jgi:hypothetical protein
VQQSSSTYFAVDSGAVRGWQPSSCTATFAYVCRVAASVYTCNTTAPPPQPPPPPPIPAGSACERKLRPPLAGAMHMPCC